MSRALATLLVLGAALPATAQQAERRNWFGDPFFQAAAALPNCPEPAGPRLTLAERQLQAHHRAEKGTSCWLAGACDKPNAHGYDADIAQALKTALAAEPLLLREATLWVTVQARVVYLEGCLRTPDAAPRLEALARAVPQVQQAIAIVYDGRGRPPYKLLGAR
jgi:hypothetical protein